MSFAHHAQIDAERQAEDQAAERLVTGAAQAMPGMTASDRHVHRPGERPRWEATYGFATIDGPRIHLTTPPHVGTHLEITGLDENTVLARHRPGLSDQTAA